MQRPAWWTSQRPAMSVNSDSGGFAHDSASRILTSSSVAITRRPPARSSSAAPDVPSASCGGGLGVRLCPVGPMPRARLPGLGSVGDAFLGGLARERISQTTRVATDRSPTLTPKTQLLAFTVAPSRWQLVFELPHWQADQLSVAGLGKRPTCHEGVDSRGVEARGDDRYDGPLIAQRRAARVVARMITLLRHRSLWRNASDGTTRSIIAHVEPLLDQHVRGGHGQNAAVRTARRCRCSRSP